MTPKRVVLYPRVSSSKQVDNDSLATQRTVMQRWAKREGYAVAAVFEDKGARPRTTAALPCRTC